MIPFFPTPYPDELWYSVICRYHIRSGNPSVKYALLGARKNTPSTAP